MFGAGNSLVDVVDGNANVLLEEFTETFVVKQSVNQQQMFNNCSVTIVYKKD
jgi:hypothetical protein